MLLPRKVFSWIASLGLALAAIAAPVSPVGAAGPQSLAPGAAALPAVTYIDNRSDALATLNSYINAINRKEYARAYGYWEAGSAVGTFANFEAGFASTASVSLTTLAAGSSFGAGQAYYVIPVTLVSTLNNATTQTYVGCYVLHLSQPAIQAAPPYQPIGIKSANLTLVTSGANADTLRTQACNTAGLPGTSPVSFGSTPGAPESGAGNYIDNHSGPLEVIQSLFNALNRKEYARAYGYWEAASVPSTFAAFQQGYANTQSITWAFGTVTSDAGAGQFYYNVPVTVLAQTTGGLQTFVGCYTLHLSNPGIQAAPPFKPIGIFSGSLALVANNANTGQLMQTACTAGVPSTPPPAPTWTRISFATGATSAGVSSSLAAGEVKEYRISAGASQLMFLDITSAQPNVVLEVVGATGGQVLVRTSDKLAHWNGTLPTNQDYIVRVVSTGAATSFSLKVTIPRRISFASGATSATLTGSVVAGTTNTYVFRGLAGQTVTAAITSAGQPVSVGVYSLSNGQAVAALTTGVTSVTGKLPANGDYIIHAVPTGATTNYTLVLTIK